MPGLFSFILSLLALILIAFGIMRKSRHLMSLAFLAMIAAALLGWYQYIFPEGLNILFFTGTLATVLAVSSFFYAIYSYESAWSDL